MDKLTIKAIESLARSGDAGKTNDGDGLCPGAEESGLGDSAQAVGRPDQTQ